jgi:ABC-type multidrug transport system fused ATPase/permease subunit
MTGGGRIRRLLRAFGPDLRVHRRALAGAYALRLASVAAAVLAPWPLKVIIDDVLAGERDLGPLGSGVPPAVLVLAMTGLFLALAGAAAVTNALEKNVSARVRERLTLRLRDRLLAHLQTLPPTFRTANRTGELVLRLVDDSDLFVRVLTKTAPLVFQYVAALALTLAAMLWLEARAAAIGLVVVPIAAFALRRYGARLWAASRRKRSLEGHVSALAQEIVRGLPVIQALGGEVGARRRFEAANAERLRAGVEETRVATRLELSMQVIQGLATAAVTGGGALLALEGRLSVGELTVLVAYVNQLLKPLEKLNDVSETTGRGMAGGERLLGLVEERPLVRDAEGAVGVGRARGLVELRDVSFAYPEEGGRRQEVLRGASMRIEPGRLAVLVGPSGAGKSTVVSLLVRLFDPTSGDLSLDGRPYRQISLRSLRSQFAVMTQEIHLFAGSIRDALVPEGTSMDEGRLWEALELVALDEFVRALPARLDTPLGEDGLNLSGGQRQRISLARAILLDRPVLLLDEPLANVDAASADVILRALGLLRETKACLAITHQPALLEYADVVYRLEGGRIAAREPLAVGRDA